MSNEPQISDLALIAGDRLVRRMQSHPLSTLGGVAAVGYVLARGVPNVLLRVGTGIAMRAVASRVMEQVKAGSMQGPGAAPKTDGDVRDFADAREAQDDRAARAQG